MKLTLFLLILSILSACGSSKAEGRKPTGNQAPKIDMAAKQPVLVELFTSEGCSSCPPADRNLTFLEKQQPNAEAEIITLAMHVTYWDELGWKDEFSSPLFTRRQEIYSRKFNLDSIYTPQMIVDGEYQFVGSDLTKAQKAISASAKNKKAPVELSETADKLKIKISELPEHRAASVYLAVVEDNLTSNVERGENSGKKLEHNSVVRELKALGLIDPQNSGYEAEIPLQFETGWKKENLKFIVFAQDNVSRKILGVNSFKV